MRKMHVPLTCEEAVREHGFSARRTIKEAMSAAMIRRCNKCGTAFIKENGCNKMMCSRQGCGSVQCYVCSKSCDYSHFNDPSRGGKDGNCPLFDSAESRHAQEIRKAEEETRKKVTEANPGIDPEHLKFHMSDRVLQDEKRRVQTDQHGHQAAWNAGRQCARELHNRIRNMQQMMIMAGVPPAQGAQAGRPAIPMPAAPRPQESSAPTCLS